MNYKKMLLSRLIQCVLFAVVASLSFVALAQHQSQNLSDQNTNIPAVKTPTPTPRISPTPTPRASPTPVPCPSGMTQIITELGPVCVKFEDIGPGEEVPDGAVRRIRICATVGGRFVCFNAYYICRNGGCYFLLLPPVFPSIRCDYSPGPPPAILCKWNNENLQCTFRTNGSQVCVDCRNGFTQCVDMNLPIFPDLFPLFPGLLPGDTQPSGQ